MLQILEFIFSDFWHYFGILVLIIVVLTFLESIIKSIVEPFSKSNQIEEDKEEQNTEEGKEEKKEETIVSCITNGKNETDPENPRLYETDK